MVHLVHISSIFTNSAKIVLTIPLKLAILLLAKNTSLSNAKHRITLVLNPRPWNPIKSGRLSWIPKPGSSGSPLSPCRFPTVVLLHSTHWSSLVLVSTHSRLRCLPCHLVLWVLFPVLDWVTWLQGPESTEPFLLLLASSCLCLALCSATLFLEATWLVSLSDCIFYSEYLLSCSIQHPVLMRFNSTYWAPYVTLVSVYQANIAGHTKKWVSRTSQ